MIEVIERLYLGGRECALDLGRLRRAGVTHVVNCAAELPDYHAGALAYRRLGLRDPDPAFAGHIAAACAFIDEGRRAGRVLVHCFAGVSRSPAVVLAYLCHGGDELEQAARRLARAAWTNPDVLFLEQLAAHHGLRVDAAGLARLTDLLSGRG